MVLVQWCSCFLFLSTALGVRISWARVQSLGRPFRVPFSGTLWLRRTVCAITLTSAPMQGKAAGTDLKGFDRAFGF